MDTTEIDDILDPDEARALAALATEDDATLWRVARSEMDANEQEEVHLLLDLQNMGQITTPQRERLLALMTHTDDCLSVAPMPIWS